MTRDIAVVKQRMDGLFGWLQENHPECFDEQKHLTEGSAERAYWHYGSAVAIRDVLRFLGVVPTVEFGATPEKIPTEADA